MDGYSSVTNPLIAISIAMPNEKELYASPNGDSWHLVRTPGSNDVFVRQTANAVSGGHVIDFAIPVFLGLGRHGPEHVNHAPVSHYEVQRSYTNRR